MVGYLQKSRMLLGIGIFALEIDFSGEGHSESAGFWTCVLDWTGLSALFQQKRPILGAIFLVHFLCVLDSQVQVQPTVSGRLQNDPEKCPKNFQSFPYITIPPPRSLMVIPLKIMFSTN